MKKIILIIAIALLSNSTLYNQNIDANEKLKDHFIYEIDFMAVFLTSFNIKIEKNGDIGLMKINIGYTSKHKKSIKETILLKKEDFDYFFKNLDTISLLNSKTDNTVGFDGVYIYNTISIETLQNSFRFWSPIRERNSRANTLCKVLIGFAKQKFQKEKVQNYLDTLCEYFDFYC